MYPDQAATRRLPVVRVQAGRRSAADDHAAVEEPLQVVVNGEAFAVVMRTPGSDAELTAGFLFAERVLRSPDEIVRIRVGDGHLGDGRATDNHVGDDRLSGDRHNVAEVETVADVRQRLAASSRRVTTSASCGLCGRQTIDSLKVEAPRVDGKWTLAPHIVDSLPGRLRSGQPAFAASGGLHAAGLFNTIGELTLVAEDVGRHNAVDKVVGRALLDKALPLSSSMLLVSGRASYEIVQKAFLAGIPMVAAVSAPSTLAVELAEEAGITLVGFVRDGRFNIYTHPNRISGSQT